MDETGSMDDNTLREGRFIVRVNRFVGIVESGREKIHVFIPNTGRMLELLIPGSRVLLAPSPGKYSRKITHVFYRGNPVFINSIEANGVFMRLLEKKPPLGRFVSILSREVINGKHRFDFILGDSEGRGILAELKSCTLGWKNISSFPDAPTIRGRDHVLALGNAGGALIFLIFHSNISLFMPNFHTDYEFYSALMDNRKKIEMHALSVEYDENCSIMNFRPVRIILPQVEPRGCYLILLHNDTGRYIDVGSIKRIFFPAGYYMYCGNGRRNLFGRIACQRRITKNKHWHVDYIKEFMKTVADFPIVTSRYDECDLAGELVRMGGRVIPRFGSSDCSCTGHLFHFPDNPLHDEAFWDMVFFIRYNEYLTG